MRDTEKGISLLELLVVLTLLAFISFIAVKSFQSWIDSSKTKEVAEKIVSDLHLAQNLAAAKGSSKIVFTSQSYSIYSPESATTPYKEVVVPDKIHLENNFSNSSLTFKRSKLPNKSGSITIYGYKRSYRIIVNATSGRIELERL